MLDHETLLSWTAEAVALANEPPARHREVATYAHDIFEQMTTKHTDAEQLQYAVESWLDHAACADRDTGAVRLVTAFAFDADSRLTLAAPQVKSVALRVGLVCAELLAVGAEVRIARCRRCGRFLVQDYGTRKAGAKPKHCPGHALTPAERLKKHREVNK